MFSKRTDEGRDAQDFYGEDPRAAALRGPSTGAAGPNGAKIARSVIQPDLVIQGAILARGELELHGLVEGDVVARSVVVGPSATILGDILGERVSISGSVRGQVSGHQVHLGESARYQGDIRRGLIAIDDGAQFEGTVRALGDADKREIAQRLAVAAPAEPRHAAPAAAPGSRPIRRATTASAPAPMPQRPAPRPDTQR